ncbi:MAG TPA: hypothetical protein VJ835_08645 [Fimbriimonadaceae bacterium]|nr:hypothetical protein [Fimbriimonadaceae bacterium]
MSLSPFERGDGRATGGAPIPWHTQMVSCEFCRIDDPELAIELACRAERNNLEAARIGLPTVGQELENQFGLRFRVQSHVYLPNVNTAHRWNNGEKGLPEDLYPVIEPINLSNRLMDFIGKVDRCTTKVFVPLDTMPGYRKDAAPRHNSIHTSDPRGLLLFLDAATLHETIFAHEVGHAWVQYVDQCEDERTFADISDPARINQLNFIQSYVLDLKVNELLRHKGFDMDPIDGDQTIAMNNMARLLDSGFSPPSKREAVFGALMFAEQIVERERGNRSSLLRFDDVLTKLKQNEPEVYRLATGMSEAVFEFGVESKEAVCSAIDKCLDLAFEFTGDQLDYDRELVVPPTDEPDFDKWPHWIPGAMPRVKCQVGRVMALHDIPDDSMWSLSCERISGASLSFELNDGSIIGPWKISTPYSIWNLNQMKELDKMNKEASERFTRPLEKAMKINEANRARQQAAIAAMIGPTVQSSTPHGIPNPSASPHVPSHWVPFPTHVPGRRPYMAGLGRFLTEARLAEVLAGEHPYAYAMNNPTTYVEPDGMLPKKYGWSPWQAEQSTEYATTLSGGHSYLPNHPRTGGCDILTCARPEFQIGNRLGARFTSPLVLSTMTACIDDPLTKAACRAGCDGAFPGKSQGGVRQACYKLCTRLKGNSCQALWNLCQHMSRHNEQGTKSCLQLYNAVCSGE